MPGLMPEAGRGWGCRGKPRLVTQAYAWNTVPHGNWHPLEKASVLACKVGKK